MKRDKIKILERKIPHSGFLTLEKLRCATRINDGYSPPYSVEVVHRRGVDCVSAVIYFRAPKTRKIMVGIRRAHRASLYSRKFLSPPLKDKKRYDATYEAVAGSAEPGDRGIAGLKRRMAQEILEETGLSVKVGDLKTLGAGFFPSHGQSTEKIYLFAVRIPPVKQKILKQKDAKGGEAGGILKFFELNRAISLCVKGVMEDPKIELGLRRLKERLR